MTFVGVVCGLKSERAATESALATLSGAAERFRVGVSGADARRAETIARAFANEGCAALLSIGVSGGLDPALATGALVVTSDVFAKEGRIEVRRAALAPMIAAQSADAARWVDAPIWGADDIVQSPEDKAALFKSTGAVAVDMESHGAARAARTADIPFLALRAIADPASRALPDAALGSVAPDGSVRAFSTLLKCAKAPGDFPALLQLGADSEQALKTLRRSLGLFFGGLLLRLDL